MLWESQTETWDTKAFQETIFISIPAVAQQSNIQRLSPKYKGVLTCIPLQAGYRRKKQGLTHIQLHVTLLATSPQCYTTFFMYRFFKFYLPAMPSPPPAALLEQKLAYFIFFCPPPFYSAFSI
jgi:hypothetical protein